MPLARQVVQDLAVEHGACIRPVQLRRTNLDTGEVDQVLVPCGHTLAHVCPSCAERARTLRAAQCREGWHLEDEPDLTPDPATDDQQWWVTMRADAQQPRDQAEAAGQDTADFDELIRELDEEITKSGIRGNVPPDQPARRHRSTRRRQDTPDLPRRKVSPRTLGQDLHRAGRQDLPPVDVRHADLPVLRPGRRRRHPGRPGRLRLRPGRPGRAAFAALFDRFIQNLRRYLGYDVQYFAAVEPQRRLAPHIHIAIRGTVSRAELRRVLAATYHQVWWPDAPAQVTYDGDELPVWHDQRAATSTRPPGEVLPTWDEALDAIGREDEPWHVARFGDRFDAQGVLAGSQDAARCIGYLTKYLTKQVADCHQADHRRPAGSRRPAGRGAAVSAVLAAVRELAPLRHPAQERPARPGPRPVQGQGPRRRSPRLRRAPGPGLPQVVRQDAGRPPRRPQGLAAGDARCFGNRPGPVRLGTRRPGRPGPHGTRPAAAARRRRPAPMAGRTRRGQTQSRDATGR